MTSFAAEGSEAIKQDMTNLGNSPKVPLGDAKYRDMEKSKRELVEKLENFGINAGLYLEGLTKSDTKGDVDPYELIVTDHFPVFCDAQSPKDAGWGGTCKSDPLLAHGDIKLSTILSGSVLDSDERAKAAAIFMRNLVDPFPSDTLKIASEKGSNLTDKEVQMAMANALIEQARLSVARQSISEMIAKRTKGSNEKSVMQQMEEQSTRYYLDSKWQTDMQNNIKDTRRAFPHQAVLYDIAVMDSYRTWQEFERYKQGERIEALLATMVAQMSSQTRVGQAFISETKKSINPEDIIPGGADSLVPGLDDIIPSPSGGGKK